MSKKLINQIENNANFTLTENLAVTHKSTKSSVLDMFSQGGAYRTRSDDEIISLFRKAFAEDNLLAMKGLFYLRDVRKGQGERRFFRVCTNWLAAEFPDILAKNLKNISEFGRWDDLISLYETGNKNLQTTIVSLVSTQLNNDRVTEYPSLLGKWMPSENTSSVKTKKLAFKLRTALEFTPKQYRKMLSRLRNKIKIVETAMCSGNWEGIEYSKVPSKAMSQYRKAFIKHDQPRFSTFLTKVEKGEAKINSSVMAPPELLHQAVKSSGDALRASDAQWNSLPNYFPNEEVSALAVVDVSGSMWTRISPSSTIEALDVSIAFGIYMGERCKGPFKDVFLTFSSSPEFVRIKGNNLKEKYNAMKSANWGGSTNLQASMDLILKSAIDAKCSQEELPKWLFIFSDMEFNYCGQNTNLTTMRKKFENAGYELPQVVFWNVCSRTNQSPAVKEDKGVVLVSGYSPTVISSILSGRSFSPYSLMLDVLNGERYNCIVV